MNHFALGTRDAQRFSEALLYLPRGLFWNPIMASMANEDKKPLHQILIARAIEELVSLSRHLDAVIAERDELQERLRIIHEAVNRSAPDPSFAEQKRDLVERQPVEPVRVLKEPEAKAPNGNHKAPAPLVAPKPGMINEDLQKYIAHIRNDFENKTYPVPPQAPTEEFSKQDAERCEAVSQSGSRCTRPKGHQPPHQHDSRMAVQSWGEER